MAPKRSKNKRTQVTTVSEELVEREAQASIKPIASDGKQWILLDGNKWLGPLLLSAVVLIWFWPVLIGRLPIGGEITSVYLPKMTFYAEAMSQGRVPLWNEREDFGTPAVADGQIGVFYPLNQILFRLFSPWLALGFSIFLHHWFAGLFAYCCARCFHLKQTAATLVGLMFVGQSFFALRVDQPWAITTACWLPLAVAAVWQWLRVGSYRWLFALPLVLAMQLLAGHFQVAFFTVVILLVFSFATLFSNRNASSMLRFVAVPVAILFAFAIAAVQILPSAELLVCGDWRGRGQGFTSSFAAHPVHWFCYIAPQLFSQDPVWDAIVWVPWKTSAQESIAYSGVVPFLLAVYAVFRLKADERIRIWGAAAFIAILFSIGSSLPGYSFLVQLPGFGWFTAPARWNVVIGLFLALLAGWAIENGNREVLLEWFQTAAKYLAVGLAVSIGSIVLLGATSPRFDQAPAEYRGLHRILAFYNAGYSESDLTTVTPVNRLLPAMICGLIMPCAILLAIISLGRLRGKEGARTSRQSQYASILIILAVIDLTYHQYAMRTVHFENRKGYALSKQKLATLSNNGEHRVAGVLGSFANLSGGYGLTAPDLPDLNRYWDERYRSEVLDVWPETISTMPPVGRWGDWGSRLGKVAREGFSDDDLVFFRMANIRTLVCGFMSTSPPDNGSLQKAECWTSPWLLENLYGSGIYPFCNTEEPTFQNWKVASDVVSARAWIFPEDIGTAGTDPRLLTVLPPARRKMLRTAIPVTHIEDQGEIVQLKGIVERPSVLVLSDTNYPGWTARLKTAGGTTEPSIDNAFGQWMAVHLDQPGNFELTLSYEPDSLCIGSRISVLSMLLLFAIGTTCWISSIHKP